MILVFVSWISLYSSSSRPWKMKFFSNSWSSSALIRVSNFFCFSSFLIICLFSCLPVQESVSSFRPHWCSLICLISSLTGSNINFIPAKICLFSSSWSGFSSFCFRSVGFTPPVGLSLFILFFGGDFCGLRLPLSLVHLLLFVNLGLGFNCSFMLGCLVVVWSTPVAFVLFALVDVSYLSPTCNVIPLIITHLVGKITFY